MPQRALSPSLAELRRAQVLPPEENDTERLQNLYRIQNEKRVPVVDEALLGLTGAIQGFGGAEPNNIRALRGPIDYGRMIGQLAGNLPGEQGMKAIPMLGMTRFMKEGKPDRLGRMIGTETYKIMMEKMGMKEVGDEFAKRYPRISAHIRPFGFIDNSVRGAAFTKDAFEKGVPTIDVGLNPFELQARDQARQTMSHEATHVAQRLGMEERMHPAYEEANKDFGYELNPFEMSARNASMRYTLPNGRALIPPTTLSNISEAMTDMAGNKKQVPISEYIRSLFSR